ncbi:hypothetical protein H9Q10_09420 [Eikenella sp. S3360]|uniref:Uncharacterized protein n=1 Tax=Eikenella glucosivorans TaxID=2766967 RepID=A0ABS0NC66_9NEIS|nr:DUF5984 family protein [Eikenella glucosivorans]MBH5329883.1 hypothetical protein [Eikenella glucosivorans]
MPLFDFTLKNIKQTLEFNHSSPSWFWLTDGSYNICINGKRLLSYHPDSFTAAEQAQLKQQARKNGLPFCEPDYYIVRLYEDLLYDALPYTWCNVGEIEHQCLLNPTVHRLADKKHWDNPILDEDIELLEKCMFRYGNFGSGHMLMPEFRVWRYADEIYIYWDGRHKNEHGVPYFRHAGEAVFVISHRDFMREAYDFHHRLMNAMAERIRQIQTGFPDFYPVVQDMVDKDGTPVGETTYDLAGLLAEHRKREREWEQALQNKNAGNPNFEQDNLRAGIHLRQLLADHLRTVDIIRITGF